VPQLREALPLVTAEFERARRYERTLTVAVLSLNGDGPAQSHEYGRAGAPRVDRSALPAVLASVVREAVRETDLVACDRAGRRCIVVMPEIGPEEGRRAVSRLRQLCDATLSCAVQADSAVFPGDGWTFQDLVQVAQRNSRSGEKQKFVVPASDPAA